MCKILCEIAFRCVWKETNRDEHSTKRHPDSYGRWVIIRKKSFLSWFDTYLIVDRPKDCNSNVPVLNCIASYHAWMNSTRMTVTHVHWLNSSEITLVKSRNCEISVCTCSPWVVPLVLVIRLMTKAYPMSCVCSALRVIYQRSPYFLSGSSRLNHICQSAAELLCLMIHDAFISQWYHSPLHVAKQINVKKGEYVRSAYGHWLQTLSRALQDRRMCLPWALVPVVVIWEHDWSTAQVSQVPFTGKNLAL